MEPAMMLALAVVCLGILNTIYLTVKSVRNEAVYCLFLPDEWCQKVQHSKYSKTLGIPNPYLGLGMLSVILALLLLYANGIIPLWPAMGLISFGFLFSMYFLYIQAFIIKAFCTWCVVSAVVFTALAALQFSL
jgi:uncharacterized membrane protein